ncbi:MAG: YifB family Mg chelatase-like AAA ATPase [Cellvibrionaceae bacterium]|nr:YifB family Mg chelatase-like AAA ATPase [Cellvibrionaceae bacterium]
MSLAIAYSRARLGIDAPLVTVETHISGGLPRLTIVGLAETAVKEAKDRVRSAILNSHFEFPPRRITINLAPADLPKDGGRFDLAIALGILAASGQVPNSALADYEFLGELALSGELRAIPASLGAALSCGLAQRQLILPQASAAEAALSDRCRVLPAANLLQVCAHLNGNTPLSRAEQQPLLAPTNTLDLAEVRGQNQAKRALEISAAANHNLIFYGEPGTGKTMLAQRLPSLLGPLDTDEAIEVAKIHSCNKPFDTRQWGQRPFRSPHHSASSIALVGGGSNPQPGEISLAHRGVLFLDELPEFPRSVLEALREPLENGEISIARAKARAQFPAQFQLIAAMNPCPCGYAGSNKRECRCSPAQVQRYRQKISGPLLDRIDLQVPVQALPPAELATTAKGESSEQVRARVLVAQALQRKRQGKLNAQLRNQELEPLASGAALKQLRRAMAQLHFSTRAYHRILKLARTIADLDDQALVEPAHIAEALSFRGLDRELEL